MFIGLSDRKKIEDILKENIKRYRKEYIKLIKSIPKEDLIIKKLPLTDKSRVILAYNYIFGLTRREQRNYYLNKFIDLFTRRSDKSTESINYLYSSIGEYYIGGNLQLSELPKHYDYQLFLRIICNDRLS